MSTETTESTWGNELADAGLGGMIAAIENPLAALDELIPEGVAGEYWGVAPVSMERQVEQALAALERLVTQATHHATPQYRARLTSAVDRALADPTTGFLKRLRVERSRAVRAQIASGTSVEIIADDLGISVVRVRQLRDNNKTYCSPIRALALESLREQTTTARAAQTAERAAARTAAKAGSAAERAAHAASIRARLAAGEDRAVVQVELGWSRQRMAQALTEEAA